MSPDIHSIRQIAFNMVIFFFFSLSHLFPRWLSDLKQFDFSCVDTPEGGSAPGELSQSHGDGRSPTQLDIVSSPSEAACCFALRRRFSMLVVLLLWLVRPPAADACRSGLFHTCWA